MMMMRQLGVNYLSTSKLQHPKLFCKSSNSWYRMNQRIRLNKEILNNRCLIKRQMRKMKMWRCVCKTGYADASNGQTILGEIAIASNDTESKNCHKQSNIGGQRQLCNSQRATTERIQINPKRISIKIHGC